MKRCLLYWNSGTYQLPVWNEVTLWRDMEFGLIHSRSQASKIKKEIAKFLQSRLQVEAVARDADAFLGILKKSSQNRDLIEFAIADGDITESGTNALRASYSVLRLKEYESKSGVTRILFDIAIGYAIHAPTRFTI